MCKEASVWSAEGGEHRVASEKGRFHNFAISVFVVSLFVIAGCAPRGLVRTEIPQLKKEKGKAAFIRVNILESTNNVRISGKDSYRVAMGSKKATLPAGKEWHIKLVKGKQEIVTKGSRKGVVKDPTFPVIFSQKVKSGFITVNGLPYRGMVRVSRVGVNNLLVTNIVPMEDYLRSVVPSEIGSRDSTTIEAARAQAVAARTYAVSKMGKRKSVGYDVVASTSDQVYSGAIKESRLTDRAVSETKGIILMHRGKPVKAAYHSTCGGHTCSNEDAWFGSAVRYLRARPDKVVSLFGGSRPFCKDSPMFQWSRSWGKEDFEKMVKSNLASIQGRSIRGLLKSIQPIKRDKFGRVVRIRVVTTEATYIVQKSNIRRLFRDPKRGWVDLRSNNFRLKFNGWMYTIEGKGWGHGVGMCQWGAIGMARKGFKYNKILEHYYSGAYLAKVY